MKSQREDCLPQTLRVTVVSGKMTYECHKYWSWRITTSQRVRILAKVDLRSAGYHHITRDGIQRCLHERFIFLNEMDSQDYFSLTHTSDDINDKIPQKNIRLDIRKTPINGTVKTPRCKDDANKDPYPWLDDNDPRTNVTDKEST